MAAGVIGFTRSLGKELAKIGVLGNCVAPAVAKTELFSQMPEMVAWLVSPFCTLAAGAAFDLCDGRATY